MGHNVTSLIISPTQVITILTVLFARVITALIVSPTQVITVLTGS